MIYIHEQFFVTLIEGLIHFGTTDDENAIKLLFKPFNLEGVLRRIIL